MSSMTTQQGLEIQGRGVQHSARGVLRRGVQMLGAGAWGMALGVIGLWILVGASLPGALNGLSAGERVLVGGGMMCGGQLVFLMFVAERIFRSTPRRLTGVVHWVLMVSGGVCFVLFALGRMLSGGA